MRVIQSKVWPPKTETVPSLEKKDTVCVCMDMCTRRGQHTPVRWISHSEKYK